MKSELFSIIIGFLLFASCQKDQKQAQRSLEGTWNVTAIESNYGDFSEAQVVIDSSAYEQGNLGTFRFGESEFEFEFEGNDSLHQGSGKWLLNAQKVNEGFVRVNQFTLILVDMIQFDVQFGDATKNAEKNAKTAIFSQEEQSGSRVQVVLWLEKV